MQILAPFKDTTNKFNNLPASPVIKKNSISHAAPEV